MLYECCTYADAQLQWIRVQLPAIDDHYIKSYLHVIRGLKLGGRIPKAKCQVTRRLESAVADDGSWRVCAVCERDVCEMLIIKATSIVRRPLNTACNAGKSAAWTALLLPTSSLICRANSGRPGALLISVSCCQVL